MRLMALGPVDRLRPSAEPGSEQVAVGRRRCRNDRLAKVDALLEEGQGAGEELLVRRVDERVMDQAGRLRGRQRKPMVALSNR